MALQAAHKESPFLDAGLLLAAAMGYSRDKLLASRSEQLSEISLKTLRGYIDRRLSGEPVAYILGYKDFRHLRFFVDRRVLVPRPETEHLVELVLEMLPARDVLAGGAPIRHHDAFAGCGCVGLSIAHERPDVKVSLSDASGDALDVLSENAKLLDTARPGGAVQWSLGSVLSAAAAPLDGISANPPYVSSSFVDEMDTQGNKEPRMALDGGSDGLDLYPLIAAQALPLLKHGGFLALEIGDEQGDAVSRILAAAGFSGIRVIQDLAAQDRVVCGVKP